MPQTRTSPLLYATTIAISAIVSQPQAIAQQVVTIRASVGEGFAPASGDITKRSLEQYCDLMDMNADARTAASSLHEGYLAERKAARAERQQEILALQKQSQDDGNEAAFIEKLPSITERFEKRLTDIESGFMSDFRLLCDASDADERWTRVERTRRRETILKVGAIQGSGLDLIEILRELKADPSESASIEPLCLEYESDLDRALLAKKSLLDAQKSRNSKSFTDIDMEEFEKQRVEMKKASDAIAEITSSHARKFGAAMTDATRDRFERLLKERAFPRVYRESKVSKDMTAALGFADLTDDQRKSIEAIREQYSREVQSLNDTWAAAIRAQNESGGDLAVSFGGTMGVMRIGDEPEEIAKARASKKDFDGATRDKLASILTPEQRERLPKDDERDSGPAIMLDGGTSIRVIEKPEPK